MGEVGEHKWRRNPVTLSGAYVVIVHELGGVCTRPSLWEGGAYRGLFQQEKEHVQSSSVKWRSVYRSLPTRGEAFKVSSRTGGLCTKTLLKEEEYDQDLA